MVVAARRSSRLLATLLAIVLTAALAVAAAPGVDARPDENVRVIVQVDAGMSASALRDRGATSARALEFVPDTFVASVPEGRLASLARTSGVQRVERDALMSIDHHCVSPEHPRHNDCAEDEPDPEPDPDPDPEPTDPEAPEGEMPWGVLKIEAPGAWTTTTGQQVAVCVADTGIDGDHPNLTVTKGRNFAGGGVGNWRDRNGHGTHVAGTVAARDGFLGVAPDAQLFAAKVLGNSGSGWVSDIANGLRWCADEKAHVINMSFGSSTSSATLHDAVKYAAGNNVVLVGSSGNSGASQPGFPARYVEVIAVGATDSSDEIASWSSRGEEVNAPGVSILSTVPGGGYATYSGTSMAAPHVAGTAALVISAGTTDREGVRSAIVDTAVDIGGSAIRANAKAAVGVE